MSMRCLKPVSHIHLEERLRIALTELKKAQMNQDTAEITQVLVDIDEMIRPLRGKFVDYLGDVTISIREMISRIIFEDDKECLENIDILLYSLLEGVSIISQTEIVSITNHIHKALRHLTDALILLSREEYERLEEEWSKFEYRFGIRPETFYKLYGNNETLERHIHIVTISVKGFSNGFADDLISWLGTLKENYPSFKAIINWDDIFDYNRWERI